MEKNDVYQQWKAKVDHLVRTYQEDPSLVVDLLAFSSKGNFYQYSGKNRMLLFSQNEHATFIASFRKWKELGYSVKKSEQALKVLCPSQKETFSRNVDDGLVSVPVFKATPLEKDKIKRGEIKTTKTTYFAFGNVFDISQTTCPQKDYPKIYDMGYDSSNHQAVYRGLTAYAGMIGARVEERDLQSISLRGTYHPDQHMITINELLSDSEKVSTMSHELAHAMLHRETSDKSTSRTELEADCMSILLQSEFGTPPSETRKKHFMDHYNACKDEDHFTLEHVMKEVEERHVAMQEKLRPILKAVVGYGVGTVVAPVIKESVEQVRSNLDPVYYDKLDLATMKRDIPIDEIAKSLGYTLTVHGDKANLKEHDSTVLFLDTNSFYRFSTGVGGSNIDFLSHFGGMDPKQAIARLAEMQGGQFFEPRILVDPVKTEGVAQKAFEPPPPADGKHSRVFAYLTQSRKIEPSVVQQVMKNKHEQEPKSYCYQDERGNVVFIGIDKDGKEAYGNRRSTLTNSSFKGDLAGSNQSVGWFWDNKTAFLYVTESAIDTLSIASMMEQNWKHSSDASFLATGGVQKLERQLRYHLPQHPEIKHVVFACDNDRAGKQANEKGVRLMQREFPNIKCSVKAPRTKDWNEDLVKQSKRNKVKSTSHEMEY